MNKHNRKRGLGVLLVALGLLGAREGLGQQRPQYSQYMFNQFLINPAVAGIEDHIDLKAGYRRQWVGIEGAPETYYLSVHGALGKVDRNADKAFAGVKKGAVAKKGQVSQNQRIGTRRVHMGVGGIALRDKTGPLSRTSVHGAFAVHVPLNKYLTLAGGLTTGLVQYSLNTEELKLANPNDPGLADGRINRKVLDMGIGTWLYSNQFYVGVSAAQVFSTKLQLTSNDNSFGPDKLQNHWFVSSGVQFYLSEEVAVIPSVLVKIAQPTPVSVDANLKVAFLNRFWVGGSYRSNDAISVLAGGHISEVLSAGYSYDITTSGLNQVSKGSHEIVIGVRMNNPFKGYNWRPWW